LTNRHIHHVHQIIEILDTPVRAKPTNRLAIPLGETKHRRVKDGAPGVLRHALHR
jgi:hypothetical protein